MNKLHFALLASTALILSGCSKDPSASFSSSSASVDVGEVVKFTDGSSDAFNHVWDFGDGGSSEALNPTHVYYQPGTYDVILQVTDKKGKQTVVSTPMAITVNDTTTPHPAPSLAFVASNSNALPGEIITFTNSSKNSYNMRWDFGDGETSVVANPTHRYMEDGTFTVTLQATDASGQNVVSLTTPITVSLSELDSREAIQDAKEEELKLALYGAWYWVEDTYEYDQCSNEDSEFDADDQEMDFLHNGDIWLYDEEGMRDGTWSWYHIIDDVIYADNYYWEVSIDGTEMTWTRVQYQNCYDGNGNYHTDNITTITRVMRK